MSNLLKDNGFVDYATIIKANEGRIGSIIYPKAIVVHTTDTKPGGFKAITKSWSEKPGQGNAAHFMIGRDESDGLVQFISINRNANHAGGQTHGWFQNKSNLKDVYHPNLISIGIEIDNAGYLVTRPNNVSGNRYFHMDTNTEIKRTDVFVDDYDKAWHKLTQYQFDMLHKLLDTLSSVVNKFDSSIQVVPNGTYEGNQAVWAKQFNPWLVGHATLDPRNKTDPGTEVMLKLKEWYPI
jgi:hypothetical protein